MAAATIRATLAAAYERFCMNPVMDVVLSSQTHLTDMRTRLLAGIPTDVTTVVEIGPGTGLNFPCYPAHVAAVETLSPAATVPDALMARAAERRLFVRHNTYVTSAVAIEKGYLTADDAKRTRTVALAVAKAIGLPETELADPATVPCVFPFATGTVPAIACTLVLCTVPLPLVPWFLAEVVRVLVPESGRYYFMEHVPDGEVETKSAAWRALQSVNGYVACGCDIGRSSVDAVSAALTVVDRASYLDERALVRATYGLLVYGSGKAPSAQ
ncbi:hypothetical protein BC828DRAFT_373515 [Blastocladiella britannica]|nr:hypothetical protein BC828DRAFT_373515 [Blastocladiella britannica]